MPPGNCDTDTNSYSYVDSNRHGHCHGDGNRYGYGYLNASTSAHFEASPNAASSPVVTLLLKSLRQVTAEGFSNRRFNYKVL